MLPPSKRRMPCLWRETSMMFNLLRRALTPTLSLVDTIEQWSTVKHRLAEPPRRRVSQRGLGEKMLS